MLRILPLAAAIALGLSLPAVAGERTDQTQLTGKPTWTLSAKTGSAHSPRAQAIFATLAAEND